MGRVEGATFSAMAANRDATVGACLDKKENQKYYESSAKQIGDANNTMASKRKSMFVIFAGPQQHGGPGTRYITGNGQATDLKSRAAKFFSRADAQDFAEERGITLTDIKFIGQEDFTDSEMQMGDR